MISSSLLSKVWNPYSLLHIPMYGVLMMLLTLTFEPRIFSQRRRSSGVSFVFLSGGIATAVGILDEFQKTYIPYCNASVTDVLLDIIGIALLVILMYFIATGFHQSDFSNFTCKKQVIRIIFDFII